MTKSPAQRLLFGQTSIALLRWMFPPLPELFAASHASSGTEHEKPPRSFRPAAWLRVVAGYTPFLNKEHRHAVRLRFKTTEDAARIADADARKEIALLLARQCEAVGAKKGESISFQINELGLRAVVVVSTMTIHLMTDAEAASGGFPDKPGRSPSAN